MSNEKIRILLVDDHAGIRQSIRTLLESQPLFSVVGDCEHGECAIAKAMELTPDIMLVDINMDPMNGFTVVKEVLNRVPSIKMIAFSINNQPKYANEMFGLGAKGYVTKTSSPREIIFAIKEVFAGNDYLCEEVKKYNRPI